MAWRTAFTELIAIEHPIALAPMGGPSGGALAAAVSNGGGLGLVGAGDGNLTWLERELEIVVERTGKPWGVGFLSWAAKPAAVERALEFGPHAVMMSFGDPAPLAEPVLAAGVRLIVQVTGLAEAERALEVSADVLVAQGAEAGGHGGGRATLPFVPKAGYRVAAADGDLSVIPVWAGEGIDLITELTPAADLVAVIAAEAEESLLRAGRMVG